MIEIANGSSVTSKRPPRVLTGLGAKRAQGCRVALEDGRELIDWQMGLHGALYGHRPGWWVKALQDQLGKCCATSFSHYNERVVAELLAEFYPDIESVRLMTNGSDPCTAAVKLARAVTGRDRLLVYGYHGTASAYCSPPEVRPGLAGIDMRRGTLEAERKAFVPLAWGEEYKAWEGCENSTNFARIRVPVAEVATKKTARSIAAVIVECPPVDGGKEAASSWLRWLANWTHGVGALFVLDEVVTGFRYGPGGAAEYYGLRGLVDLYCFGKTLGNGYPVAALAGCKAIMDELANGVHFSGTFFGDPLGLAAARATLTRLREDPPWFELEVRGNQLMEMWNGIFVDSPFFQLVGHYSRPIIRAADQDRASFGQLRRFLFHRGHFIVDHPWYMTTAHHFEEIDELCEQAAFWLLSKE